MKVESFFEDGFSWSKIADEPKCGNLSDYVGTWVLE